MHLSRVLLVTLAMSVTVGSGEVIAGGPKIDPNCKWPQPCSTLNFYDESGAHLGWVHGTNESIKFTGVSKVDTVGEHGCYTIYQRKKFKSSSLCMANMERVTIGTQDAEYEKTVIK